MTLPQQAAWKFVTLLLSSRDREKKARLITTIMIKNKFFFCSVFNLRYLCTCEKTIGDKR